eukprot:4639431-Prymnesium_polylepis.1
MAGRLCWRVAHGARSTGASQRYAPEQWVRAQALLSEILSAMGSARAQQIQVPAVMKYASEQESPSKNRRARNRRKNRRKNRRARTAEQDHLCMH